MSNDLNLSPPSTLVIEYKSTSLIARGIISILVIIALFVMTEALTNILAVILLSIWFIVAVRWIKKAYFDSALIITDIGIKIHDKLNIGWNVIDNFFINTIVVDGEEAERLIINSRDKDFKFDMEDLNVDKERLIRWIKFYKQSQNQN